MQRILSNPYRKVLAFGPPKGGGKTTFALSAPQPTLVLNFDGGQPGLPPGVGPDIWIQNYPPSALSVSAERSAWSRDRVIGGLMIQDVLDVRNAMAAGAATIQLKDHETGQLVEMPRPETIVLDGLVAFNSALLDWLLANENMKDPEDAGKDTLRFWGKRLDRFVTILKFLLPVQANIVLNTWEADEMDKKPGEIMAQPTGRKVPDIGGKLDRWGAGMVDASLYCYPDNGKFMVCTKPNNLVKCVGVRGRYDLPAAVDVTITKPTDPLPWERVWGRAVSTEKKLDLAAAVGGLTPTGKQPTINNAIQTKGGIGQ